MRTSRSVEETHAFAAEAARTVKIPAIILLKGELGAGKTEWVRGFVKSYLGHSELVLSPTYTLINAYENGNKRVYHVDLYRLQGEDDLESIGFWDLLGDLDAVIIVEWAEKISSLLPAGFQVLSIEVQLGGQPHERVLIQS